MVGYVGSTSKETKMTLTPPYDDEAGRLVQSVQKIIEAVKTHGSGTMLVMTVLSELMTWAGEAPNFSALPTEEKKKFLVEVFDQAIGSEDHALVTQLGFLSGEALEQVSDAMKGVFLAYMESKGLV